MITRSYAHEWDRITVPEVGHSQRSTTSSRHPGVAIRGTIAYRLTPYVTCEACGRLRRAGPWPHAPRYLTDGRKIDCAGKEVP